LGCGDKNTSGALGPANQSDAAAGAPADAAAAPGALGNIRVDMTSVQTGGMLVHNYAATAAFWRTPTPPTASCTSRVVSPCTVYLCQSATADASAGEIPTYFSAGVIRVARGAETISLQPDSASSLYPRVAPPSSWTASDTLTVSAAGADHGVPSFGGTISGPGAILVKTIDDVQWPAFGTTIDIQRANGVRVSWQDGRSAGKLKITITGQEPTQVITVQCPFDAGAGSGMVPAAAMTDLPAGAGSISAIAESTVSATAGDFAVDMTIGLLAMTPAGLAAAQTQVR
jgi:hypothetical protein